MKAATLKKSFNEAIEELEEPLDELLEKSRDAEIDDEDELDDDDEVLDDDDELSKSDDEDNDDDEDDDEDDDDTILAKAREIVKSRKKSRKLAKAKKMRKKKMTDDDYTDDEIDDDDDEDMDDMDKAILMENDEVSRDRQVLNVGKGMKTIIYMRKSMRSQGRLIKSLRKDVRDLTNVLSGNVQLTQKIGELVLNNTNLSKAIKEEIDEIGDQPERTKTVKKSKRGADFENPTNAAEMNVLLEKSVKAVQDHRLPSDLIPMLETRVRSLPGNPDIDLFEPTGIYSDHWLALKGYLKAS